MGISDTLGFSILGGCTVGDVQLLETMFVFTVGVGLLSTPMSRVVHQRVGFYPVPGQH